MTDAPTLSASDIGTMILWRPIDLPTESVKFINISFSSMGMDLAMVRGPLKAAIRSGTPGFYVDIGCSHPMNISNTFLLYCYGWSGLCVDADLNMIQYFKHIRPRDKVVHAAVCNDDEPRFWGAHKNLRGMSDVRKDVKAFTDEFHPPVPVQSVGLKKLFDTFIPKGREIDLMCMDIELGELDALHSNDWSIYRPRLIFLETVNIDPENLKDYPTISFLMRQGYKFSQLIVGNVLMERSD